MTPGVTLDLLTWLMFLRRVMGREGAAAAGQLAGATVQSPRETRGSLSVQTLQAVPLLLVVLTTTHKAPLVHVFVVQLLPAHSHLIY